MQTALIIWFCGAFPMLLFMLDKVPPRRLPEWIGFVGIIIFWPAFIVWTLWPSK